MQVPLQPLHHPQRMHARGGARTNGVRTPCAQLLARGRRVCGVCVWRSAARAWRCGMQADMPRVRNGHLQASVFADNARRDSIQCAWSRACCCWHAGQRCLSSAVHAARRTYIFVDAGRQPSNQACKQQDVGAAGVCACTCAVCVWRALNGCASLHAA